MDTMKQKGTLRDFKKTPANMATAGAGNSAEVITDSPAVAMIEEGNVLEEQGRIAEAMARYDAAIQSDPRCARAHLNRGNILLASSRTDAARSAYERAITCDPNYAAAHFNLGNLNFQAGEFEHALGNYRVATGVKPDFADAFVAMANTLDRLNRADEAVQSYEQALAINPGYAEVHFNLGVLSMSRGRHDEAASSLRNATEIRPDFARAHHILGVVLNILGQLDTAEASLRQAWAIEPESDEILCDLAMMLLVRGKSPEGAQLIANTRGRAPTQRLKVAFVRCVAYTRFTINNSQIREALTTAITEPWGVPCGLCQSALSMILLSESIGGCVRFANELWPARLPARALFGPHGLAALSADSLFRAVLETTPVTTIEFERFLTCARYALLESASNKQALDRSDIAEMQFYAALSRQCFVNDYVFYCDDQERLTAAACRTRLLALLDANVAVPPLLLLAVAAYFPLHTLPDPSRLLSENQLSPVETVLRQQILEPLEEQTLRADIDCLTSITGGVSEEVRDQYEQSPYPRWVKLPFVQPLYFNEGLRQALRFAPFTPLPDDSAPEALIAGCGTGSQPIIFTQRFCGVRVLAIDLSLSSLSYAKRKTRELGITNIEYAQADILKLGSINRTFDIIESVGVLHHLADPFIGWQILLTRLRPGGFMGLGFYSELARRHLVKAREFIAACGYASTPDDIRRFRQDLVKQHPTAEVQWLTTIPDFYSTSECRDLLFHVREHRLTLSQIERFISEHGLQFIGFELDPRVLQQYRARFANDAAGTNLRNWARFEAENPDTFIGMYRFWIQKPTNH
jgi:tetratricopeptide (TPR) repeat protein/SAM-dependent methyltransferase